VLTNHKHIRQVPVRSASFRVGIPHSPLLPNSHVFPSGPSSSSPYRVGEHCRVTPRTIRFSSSICVHAIWKDNGNRTGSLTPGCFVPFTKSHFPHYRPAQQETAAADLSLLLPHFRYNGAYADAYSLAHARTHVPMWVLPKATPEK
jgi:hypothetical protein